MSASPSTYSRDKECDSPDEVSVDVVRAAGRRMVMSPEPVPEIVSTGTGMPGVLLGTRSTSAES